MTITLNKPREKKQLAAMDTETARLKAIRDKKRAEKGMPPIGGGFESRRPRISPLLAAPGRGAEDWTQSEGYLDPLRY